MTDFSRLILDTFQVRKKRAQKDAFIDLMKQRFPALQVETGRYFGVPCKNLVLGDVDAAKVVLTAHYDTCAVLPLPNFLAPRNLLISLLYQLVLALALLLPAFLVHFLCTALGAEVLGNILWLILLIAACLTPILGPPNRHTANDNTSGVITLIEIYSRMSEEQKSKTAFVWFDHEESGLFGSAAFEKRHRKMMKQKLVVNFDCVSDGDELLIIFGKKAKAELPRLQAAFDRPGKLTAHFNKASTTMYPSDQINFKKSVGVAVFRRHPLVGYYISRIHTPKDTVFEEENIRQIADSAVHFVSCL